MSRLTDLLRVRSGPMTADMVLRPAAFGLGRVPARLQPAGFAKTVCGFCSTGCGLKVHLNAKGEAINLSPDPAYPVNLGMACPKGWEALTPLAATDRATAPLLRQTRDQEFAATDWSTAIGTMVDNFRKLQREHGPGALAVLSTGQIVTEEMALLGALTKFGMGIPHLDSNTRQCMATSHVAYKQSFGFDAPPYTYADFEESDALIFIGSNPCIAHPIMWQRVMRNRRRPEIVVIDPRKTETAQAATLHVPLRPKSDLTLLYGIARHLIARGAVNRAFVDAHTSGYEAFAEFVNAFTLERVAAETGIDGAMLDRIVSIITSRERVSFWWTMGVNQGHESTRTAQAIINLALMTGNIGRPGTGANSITGQCNAMGSRLFGNATSLLGGHDFGNAEHRDNVASVLGIAPTQIPDRTGYAYDQILDAIDRREIRGLWVIATNTAHSWINQSRARDILAKLDYLVVQDMYATTETAQLAHLVLPAAGWGEKEGVLINSERRLAVVRKVARAPGAALSDFAIFKLVAEHWGCGELFRAWTSPEAAFQLLKKISAGRPCDFTGVRDYDDLEREGGIQWPFTAREARLMQNEECRMENEDTGTAAEGLDEGNHSAFSILHSSLEASPPAAGGEASCGWPFTAREARLMQNEECRMKNENAEPDHRSTAREARLMQNEECRMENENPGTAAEGLDEGNHSAFSILHSSLEASPPAAGGEASCGSRRLFGDGRFYTPDGRARFVFSEPTPMPEPPDATYPFLLLTGRGSSAQWHTGSRTNKSAVLRKLAPTTLTIEINPFDARRLAIAQGDRVRIQSRRGVAEAIAVVTATISAGQVFLPMHFETVNRLTFPAFDPHSRQPSYKACAVAISRG